MTYRFDAFEVDPNRFEISYEGKPLSAEPKVLSLLIYLVEGRDSLISKDELIENIWEGRAISDWTLMGCVKSVRQLLGDDGTQQKYIKTVRGVGFRFVGELIAEQPAARASKYSETAANAAGAEPAVRRSVAILPFRLIGVAGPHAPMAEALPHEIISELSKLRWLQVIARESSFQMDRVHFEAAQVKERLGADYCLTGALEIAGDHMNVMVELVDCDSGHVIWAERYGADVEGVHDIRRQIVAKIISALDIQIPAHEAQNVRYVAPEHLDTWQFYHLGLDQLYRFTRESNERAKGLFEKALAIEPGFSRAHSGIAFVYCTNVTSQLTSDVKSAVQLALEHAEQALALDSRDPLANLSMGRAVWLIGDAEASWRWADRAVKLSPSYAQGLYARSWPENALDLSDEALSSIKLAMKLSPMDPLSSAMCIVRATSHFQQQQTEKAVRWAKRGASEPGANGATWAITAAFLEDAGETDQAYRWAAQARKHNPSFKSAQCLQAMMLQNPSVRDRISIALAKHGM